MEKIKKIKNFINLKNLDGYIIPKNDDFFSEYVPNHKDRLKKISGFTGSYGFALILKKENYLFVDGRYTLQANKEAGQKFKIITIPKKKPEHILKGKNLKIGYNPQVHTEENLKRLFLRTKCKLFEVKEGNLINQNNFTKKKIIKVFKLKDNEAGESIKSKLKKIVYNLNKQKLDLQFITSSENASWLLNIRSDENQYTPIVKSRALVDKNGKIYLFLDSNNIKQKLFKNFENVKIIDVKFIKLFLSRIKSKKICIDKNTCSIYLKNILEKNNKIIYSVDPIYLLKSKKNQIEINNIKKAHLLDGVAVTRFLIWIKNNFEKKRISEINAQNKLLKFRKEFKKFVSLSFPTISGTGANAAVIHYRASPQTNKILKKGELYLVDSGGQYKFGTTDVTRTISLKNYDDRIKEIYTRVLKGHIAVANFKIKKNTTGSQIDLAARNFLKQKNLNYNHGTGHGVGYFANVHEGPQAISIGNKVKLLKGMVLSNEPGYYEKDKFGIRIENLIILNKSSKKNLKFENLTLVPIDKNLIIKELMSMDEIKWLNNYHKTVFFKLNKFMNYKERSILKDQCSNI